MKKINIIVLALILALFVPSIPKASAMKIEKLSNVPVQGDFAIGSGKVELFLNAGASTTKEISITNRLGKDAKFRIEVEDFGPSDNKEEVTKLYGNQDGPYSLRNYLNPEVKEVSLKHGEQATVSIGINIPKDAPAGDLYGAVLVSNIPDALSNGADALKGQVSIASRAGVLFFVRVNGKVTESGAIKGFSADKGFYSNGPVKMSYSVTNNGNVYLNPEGTVTITNIFGSKTDELKTSTSFVLPKSTRSTDVSWNKRFMLGKYTATLDLGPNLAKQSVSFWVVPIPVIVIIVLVVIALLAIAISGDKDVKKKKSPKESIQKNKKKKKK